MSRGKTVRIAFSSSVIEELPWLEISWLGVPSEPRAMEAEINNNRVQSITYLVPILNWKNHAKAASVISLEQTKK